MLPDGQAHREEYPSLNRLNMGLWNKECERLLPGACIPDDLASGIAPELVEDIVEQRGCAAYQSGSIARTARAPRRVPVAGGAAWNCHHLTWGQRVIVNI